MVVGAALFLEVYASGNSCVIFLSRIPWRVDVTTERKNKRTILRSIAKMKPNKNPIKIPTGQRKYQPDAFCALGWVIKGSLTKRW